MLPKQSNKVILLEHQETHENNILNIIVQDKQRSNMIEIKQEDQA